MIIPAWWYWSFIIALFLIGVVWMFIKRKLFSIIPFSIKLFALLLLLPKMWMPNVYEVQGYSKVEKGILFFPINSFGGDLQMGNHCYVINATDKPVLVSATGNYYKHDTMIVPMRSDRKLNIPRIDHFFKGANNPVKQRLLQRGWGLDIIDTFSNESISK